VTPSSVTTFSVTKLRPGQVTMTFASTIRNLVLHLLYNRRPSRLHPTAACPPYAAAT
jgi:hypothetical protein